MKLILFFVMLALFTRLSLGLDECTGTVLADDVPCLIFLPSTGVNCTATQVQLYRENITLSIQTMDDYSPAQCNATFNYSSPIGTYNFNYTTGDTGSIIVKEGIVINLLLYFGLATALIVWGAGIWLRDANIISLAAIVLVIMGLFIWNNGFSVLNNLVTQTLGMIFAALGSYLFIRVNMEAFQEII